MSLPSWIEATSVLSWGLLGCRVFELTRVLGNAKIAGMMDDLQLTGGQYNIALTVFFFPYALFEVPSNIVLKLMKPSWWICLMMVTWGIVMTMQGIVQSYNGLIVTRTLLGLTESGFFPAGESRSF